ncbi:MAG: ATP-binding protein [Actinomycetota bacterium]
MSSPADDLVGRDREIGQLRAELDAAFSGRTRVVFVTGDPGIGKTRLCDALCDIASESRATVSWGRCWEAGGAPAYWPWMQALREHVRKSGIPETAPVLAHFMDAQTNEGNVDPARARFEMFDEVATFLRSTKSPSVIVLDDVHSADVPTLLLLRFVVRSVREAPILIVCTHRDAAIHSTNEVSMLLNEIAREAKTIMLAGLSKDGTATLIARRHATSPPPRIVERVHALTEGNPFFVAEVSRLLSDSSGDEITIPQSVRETVSSRLAMLPQSARTVLAAASVAGNELSVEILRRVTGDDRPFLLEQLEIAQSARLVELAHPLIRFSHAIVRETLYASIPTMERARLHRRFAEALEDGELPSEIAYHWLAAARLGDHGPAADYSRRAGVASIKVLAFEEAETHFKRAIEALGYQEEIDERERCELLLHLADAQWRAGEVAAARATFDRAASCARSIGDGSLFARAALGAGQVLAGGVWARGWSPDEELGAMLREALEVVDDPAVRARLLARAGADLHFGEQRLQGIALATRALEIAERLGDDDLLAYCLTAKHNAIWEPGTVLERLAMADRMVSLSSRLSNFELSLTAHAWRQTDLLELGRIGPAEQDADWYVSHAIDSRRPQYEAYAKLMLSARARMLGDLPGAAELSRFAQAAGNTTGDENLILSSMSQLVQTELYRDVNRAMEELDPVFPRYPILRSVRAWVLCVSGRLDEARAALAPLAQGTKLEVSLDAFYMPVLGMLAASCSILESSELAQTLLEAMEPFAHLHIASGRNGVIRYGPVSMRLGALASVVEDFDRAQGWLNDALERSEKAGSPLWTAEALLELGRMHARRGDSDASRDAIDRCCEITRKFGWSSLEHMALGVRPKLTSVASASHATMLREGDYWTLSHAGSVTRLRSSRGLEHLSKLVVAPREEIHALDLLGSNPDRGALKQDSIPMLDEEAKRAYKRRLSDAQAELDEARSFNDEGRAERLESEIEAIVAELKASVGLSGRDRVSDSSSERARIAVTKSVRSAIEKISSEIPSLGEHLAASIRTGTFCSYDPIAPLTWEVSL